MRSAPCDCNTRKGMRDCKATEDENRGETQRNVINESVAAETKDATRNGLDRRQRLRRSLCLSPGATEAGTARRHAPQSRPLTMAVLRHDQLVEQKYSYSANCFVQHSRPTEEFY